MPQADPTTRAPRLLDVLGVDGLSDPAALGRAMVRLAQLAAAEHRAQTAAALVAGDAGVEEGAEQRSSRRSANGLAGPGLVPPLNRAIAIDPRGAVTTEGDR